VGRIKRSVNSCHRLINDPESYGKSTRYHFLKNIFESIVDNLPTDTTLSPSFHSSNYFDISQTIIDKGGKVIFSRRHHLQQKR